MKRLLLSAFVLMVFVGGHAADTDHGTEGEELKPLTPHEIRLRTINSVMPPEDLYPSLLPHGEGKDSGKAQLKLIRNISADNGTNLLFPEYGESFAIDGLGPLVDGKPIFLHYNSVATERNGRDLWAQPSTLCSVQIFAFEWKKKCMEDMAVSSPSVGPNQRDLACTLQIGDLSLPTNARNKNGRCALGHKTHYNGTCVDIRPVGSAGLVKGAVKRGSTADSATRRAIKFAESMGATNPIWQAQGHYDHFHICFPEWEAGRNGAKNDKSPLKNGPLKGCYGF